MKNTAYRSLNTGEIEILEAQGCQSDSWQNIQVKEGFDAQRIRNTIFSGDIRLGVFSKQVTFQGGVKLPSGISSATLHNCTIGDECYISGVRNYIANYDIADNVIIDNIEIMYIEGETSFGNGTSIAVLNETGGREVLMYDRLSAHLAYIMALYRHRPKVIEKIDRMIAKYAKKRRSSRGHVGQGSIITNAGQIRNVWIGENAIIESVTRLDEGSVNSSHAAPVKIGCGVNARHFIVSSGSSVTDSCLLDNCFIGQGVVLGRYFSAENSLFFSNCVGFHGEACSIFAGPYTVTHHKSTLLIAAYYSFLNAGSGSNQSNHMYKLGPIHQGIIERGSKTTSDSYMLWPARVGAFTLVMGRHYKNSDTTDLPFSYLIESQNESVLAPAVNLQSVGTIRDAQKWPKRDKRKDPDLLDQINFNLLSPFTIQKMWKGRKILNSLRGNSGRHSDYYFYENCKIQRRSLERGVRLYTLGIHKFLGNSLISRMEKKKVEDIDELFVKLESHHRFGAGEWVDLAGLFAPKSLVDDLLNRIETKNISDLQEIQQEFSKWHKDYYEMEWTWAKSKLEEEFGIPISKYNSEDVIKIIESWKDAVVGLDKLLYEDAKKEFALSSQTGFGVDGSEAERDMDFEEVRGDFEKNPAVSAIRDHMDKKAKLGDRWIEKMR
ncbi:MAG: DUF4954 family protein [Bacteroidales bacterium]|nr:DUF4954 family protein [Bacteroidales bacterium]